MSKGFTYTLRVMPLPIILFINGTKMEEYIAYKIPFTQKFPYQYIIRVKSYIAKTTNEQKWIELQKQLDEKELSDFTNEMVVKLEIVGFDIVQNGRG